MNIYKAYKKLLFVNILISCTAISGAFVDGIVVSRLMGVSEMAAFGFAQSFVAICSAASNVLLAGTRVLCGKCLGKGSLEDAGKCASLMIVVGEIMALFFAVIMFFFSKPLIMLFGARGELVPLATQYLKGLAPAMFPFMIAPAVTAVLQMDGEDKLSVLSVAVMSGINIVLDLLNALWIHGGMAGMALATTISYFTQVAIVMTHFRKKDIIFRLDFRRIDFREAPEIFKTGFSVASQMLSVFARSAVLNVFLLGLIGSSAVAAYTALNGAYPVIMTVANGFGAAIVVIAGILLGEEDRGSLVRVIKKVIRFALAVSVVMAAVMFIFSKNLAGIYVDPKNAEQLSMLSKAFKCFAFSLPFSMLVVFSINYYQSIRKTLLANIICISENAVFVILFALLLAGFSGATGVWMSFVCAEALCLLGIVAFSAIKYKRLPDLEDLLLLSRAFGVPKDDRINIAVRNAEQAVNLSDRIIDFCELHGVDKKRSIYSGLCMEEMAVQILNNNTGKDDIRIDVYLSYRDNDIYINLKDNGKPYNPHEQDRILHPEDPVSNISIRMFYRMIKKADYKYVFETNMLNFVV